MEFQNKNVFELAADHGGAGFWVRRSTWSEFIARVVRVGEITGPPPYFGNPSVLMDLYRLDGTFVEGPVPLPAPGTYKTWRGIEPPNWASTAPLRPLDDPILSGALGALERKKGKTTAGRKLVWLTVDYERKDEAKRLGARWATAERRWFLPDDAPAAVLEEARSLGFLSVE